MNSQIDETVPSNRVTIPSVSANQGKTPERLGPYRISTVLGRGGMGAVYRAQHEQTGQVVALKTVLLPNRELLQSLRREILALARLEHPGIVRIVAEGVESGLPWYAMELVEGQGLGPFAADVRTRFRDAASPPDLPTQAETRADPSTRALLEAEPATAESDEVQHTQQQTFDAAALRSLSSSALRRLVATEPISEESLRRILTLAHRLCLTLGYLHGEGIVHRDLKPGNVLVRIGEVAQQTGMPVLVDFGLAADLPFAKLEQSLSPTFEPSSRETLETSAVGSGTVAYMAPEQRRGLLVDARADLYAFGAILYELLTGRRLFHSQGPQKLPGLNFVPGTELVEGWDGPVPPRVVPLLRALLASEPQQRIGYAGTAAAALRKLGAEDDGPETWPKTKAYLYRPRFVGRQAPLHELRQALADLEEGRGRMVLVTGESGAGKTRLAMELCTRSLLRGAEVLVGECGADRSGKSAASGEALQGLRRPLRMLADRCREKGPEETRRLFEERARLLAQYEPTLLELPGVADQPEPPVLPPVAARLRLFQALNRTFLALAETSRVVLVLDDLQWGDELTLGFVEHLLDSGFAQSQPLLFVATVRSEEVCPQLEQLARNPFVQELRLERLEGTEIGDLVRDMLALPKTPVQFVDFLARKSEGNPLFIAEYLRSAVAQGVLFLNIAGQWCVTEPEGEQTQPYENLRLPLSVGGLIQGRLAALNEPARKLAEIAAVLGREVSEHLLFEMADKLLGEFLGAVEELIVREVLEEFRDEPTILDLPSDVSGSSHSGQRFPARSGRGRRTAGFESSAKRGQTRAPRAAADRSPGDSLGVRFRFVHEQLRQAAYQAIQPERLPQLHRAAAETIESLAPAERNGHLAALGFHWEQAGEAVKARAAYFPAAQQAKARCALDESGMLFRAYLRLVTEPDEESLAVMNNLAIEVLHPQGRNAEARELAAQALEIARARGFKSLEGHSLHSLGIVAWRVSDFTEAGRLLEQAAALYQELGLPKSQSRSVNVLASIRMQEHRTSEARILYQQSLELARLGGDTSDGAVSLANLGLLAREEGRWQECFDLLEQARALFQEQGNRRMVGGLLQNLGVNLIEAGKIESGESCLLEALAIQRELGDVPNQIYTLNGLGSLELERGRAEKARTYFEAMLPLCRTSGEQRGLVLCLLGMARLALLEGDLTMGRGCFEEAWTLTSTHVPDIKVELLRYQAQFERLAGSAPAVAQDRIRQARAILDQFPRPETLAVVLCEEGHQALAVHRSAQQQLSEAQTLTVSPELGPESAQRRALGRLACAQAAFEAGQVLLGGECPEDVPAPLRARLSG